LVSEYFNIGELRYAAGQASSRGVFVALTPAHQEVSIAAHPKSPLPKFNSHAPWKNRKRIWSFAKYINTRESPPADGQAKRRGVFCAQFPCVAQRLVPSLTKHQPLPDCTAAQHQQTVDRCDHFPSMLMLENYLLFTAKL